MVAVDGIGFSIAEGETYGLLGPNGAGKTTSIAMIVGVLARDAGDVLIDGQKHDVNSVKTKSLIGYVPQEMALYPDLTARQNLRFFGRMYGLSRNDIKRKTDEVLEIIGLADRADETIGGFSGGMMRRLNIGVGLIHRPRLLILDEPTVGVDPQSRNAILDSVEQLAGEGVAVLYTTHYMEEAERLCDRVGIVDKGRMQAEGTRRELVAMVGEHDRVTLTAEGDLARAAAALREMPEARQVSHDESRIELMVPEAGVVLARALHEVTEAGVTVRSVEVREPDLEAVFLHLTGKALRD
ncbi:putative ABC transporter ATP-binding protein YfiL [Sinosporangium siamense]|uniref:ABC transporter ATP-binding protein YfiL n=2 Tax=Sinosporangium siamense TaxID=1367973 RepID=A0A919RBM6_9ACTN|nr:putative ABC transporter ATP-binding protein YfiL [Sinosporangium siamense]